MGRLHRVESTPLPVILDHHFIVELQPISCKKETEMAPMSHHCELGYVSCRRVKLTHRSDHSDTPTEDMISTSRVTVITNLCPITVLDPVCLYLNNFWLVFFRFFFLQRTKFPFVVMSTFVEHSKGILRTIKVMAH